MNIWLAYVNYPITTAVYLKRALEELGHRVCTVGPRLPEEAIDLWGLQNMHLPLDALDIDTDFTPDMATLLAATSPADHPELYLWVESVNGYQPQNLHRLPCPKACWLIDTHYHLATALETAKQFDYVFIAQLVDLHVFREAHPHAYWLPLACDPAIHGRQATEKRYDVAFVGSMNPRREGMLNHLAGQFEVHRERSFWTDMARTFSASKIVLNDASFDDLNMRFFEALCAGSLLLSNPTHGSAQDILFLDGEEYACHHDHDLVEIVRQYLNDDGLRETVARRGRQRVLAAHTYRDRAEDLLNVLMHGKRDTFSPEELRARSLSAPTPAGLSVRRAEMPAPAPFPQIRSIITMRYSSSWPTWQMVQEWEDVLADRLGVSLRPLGERCSVPDPDYGEQSYDLMFFLLADDLRHCGANRQIIPIVMDLWRNDFELFRQRARNFRLVFVTNLQAYHELAPELPNLRHIPFSLADRYLDGEIPAKDIDVIQFGRRNPVLDRFMATFLQRYPATVYVTTEVLEQDGRKVFFVSNHGGILAESDSRATFMQFLGRSKVSLVSTVGMDGSRDTGGIDPVSPRFYESLAAGCHLVGRIPDNEEFHASGLSRFCRHVDDYDDFESVLRALLADNRNPRPSYLPFLRQNLTSAMVPRLLNEVHDLGTTNSLRTDEVCMQAITRPQIDLTRRLAGLKELKRELSPAVAFTNYRTLGDVIGFYAEFWGLDLFHRFTDIIAAQDTIVDALQYQALELLYRKDSSAACTIARRAMELAPPESPLASLLYADILRRSGNREAAEAIGRELLHSSASDEAQAVLDMCTIDELLPLEMEHYHLLRKAHTCLRPQRYIEIGVSSGKSLSLAESGTSVIGIDPATAIPEQQFFHSPVVEPRLFQMTSNAFFQQGLMKKEWGESPFDMAFIDGLHIFEQALMDFINLEQMSAPDSVVFLHDCLPVSIIGAERERRSMVWTGDTWKVIPCLKKLRPDLEIVTFPARPSGLAMIRNLDRNSKLLINQFDLIVEHFVSQPLPEEFAERCQLLNVTMETPESILGAVASRRSSHTEGTGTR